MVVTNITLTVTSGTYTIPVRSKYTIVRGDSGSGKTALLSDPTLDGTKVGFTTIGNLGGLRSYIESVPCPIAALDESLINVLDFDVIGDMNKSPGQYVLVTRDIPVGFSVDYRDIYILQNPKRGLYICVRQYPDYVIKPEETRLHD